MDPKDVSTNLKNLAEGLSDEVLTALGFYAITPQGNTDATWWKHATWPTLPTFYGRPTANDLLKAIYEHAHNDGAFAVRQAIKAALGLVQD